jgi:hypothetical protein
MRFVLPFHPLSNCWEIKILNFENQLLSRWESWRNMVSELRGGDIAHWDAKPSSGTLFVLPLLPSFSYWRINTRTFERQLLPHWPSWLNTVSHIKRWSSHASLVRKGELRDAICAAVLPLIELLRDQDLNVRSEATSSLCKLANYGKLN